MISTTDTDSTSDNNSIAGSMSDAADICSLVSSLDNSADEEEDQRTEIFEENENQESGFRGEKRQKLSKAVVRGSRKKATKEAHEILLRWVLSNRQNPYPSSREKKELAVDTGMTVPQVVHWMSNMRKRKLVPLLGKDKRFPRSKIDLSFLGTTRRTDVAASHQLNVSRTKVYESEGEERLSHQYAFTDVLKSQTVSLPLKTQFLRRRSIIISRRASRPFASVAL
eukprot:gene22849-29023_t